MRPTVTSENCHKKKYKVNNTKVGSLSLTDPRNQRRWRRCWRRTRNRRHVQGIIDNNRGRYDLWTIMEAAALRWRAWVIGNNDGGVDRRRWDRGLDDDNIGVGRGSRRENVSEWTSPTADAEVCLPAQVIDNDSGVGGGRRAWGLSNDKGGVDRGLGIDYASKVSETTTYAVGVRRWTQGIYDDGGSFCIGRWAQRIQQQQRRRRQRIYDMSKGLETTTKAAAARQQARWVGNNNKVLILFSIASLTVTLSVLCLVTVSFWWYFHRFHFSIHFKKYYQYCNHAENIFLPSVH